MEALGRWNYELYKFILNMTKELKLKGMTDEEFEKWAEKVVEKNNKLIDLWNAYDFDSFTAELGIQDNCFMPLILIMMAFGNSNFLKKVTKEEVMSEYAYMKDINSIIKTEEEISKENVSINEQLL